MNRSFLRPVVLSLCCSGLATSAHASFKPTLELTAGISHDSSLVVEEIEFTSDSSDEAINLEAEVAVEGEFASGLTADLSYSVAEVNYRQIDQFDLNTHLLMSSLGYDVGRVNLGFTYYRAESILDGANYLTLSSGSPTVSLFLTPGIYLQGGFANLDKSFKHTPVRDAQNQRFFISTYYFINSINHYFAFIYARRNEDANAREFTYSGNEMEFSWIKNSEIVKLDLRLKLGARIEERAYKTITVDDISSQRNDRCREFLAEVSLDISERIFTGLSYRYTQNDSNQNEMEYDQRSGEMFFGFRI